MLMISFDPLAKVVYIALKESKVKRTIEFTPETFIDLDEKGNLIGIELLNPGTLILRKIAKKYHRPELGKIHIRPLQKVYH